MNKKLGKFLVILIGSTALMGCVQANRVSPTPMNGIVPTPHSSAGYAQQQQVMVPPNHAPVPYGGNYQYQASQTVTDMNSLKERVRRVERAMIRLDRRVQLLERNELARISSHSLNGEGTENGQGMFKPMSYAPNQATQTIQPYSNSKYGYRNGYRPISASAGTIQSSRMISTRGATSQMNASQMAAPLVTSSLQVAPKTTRQMPSRSTFSNMPSLADEKNNKTADRASVSIWTIDYDSAKIWPSREQLVYSRDVVEALRSGEKVTLFARGSDPATREFRERVRAVSKYLSKVSGLETVPIASMPAKHLGGDTIELLATR